MRRKTVQFTFALAGVPNVGKSTLFNAFTGLRQHTGNWIGKTVETAQGICQCDGMVYRLIDLPGTYSLSTHSAEEECAKDYILRGDADAVIVVCDAGNLARSLRLTLEIMRIAKHVCVCLHMSEEAEKNGLQIDRIALEHFLHVPVVVVNARKKKGLSELLCKAREASERPIVLPDRDARQIAQCVQKTISKSMKKRNPDDVLLHRKWGTVLMLLLLCAVLLITIYGANIPSAMLSKALFFLQDVLERALLRLHCPAFITQMLVYGMYRTLAWVISVMLPPMAIFFPLFTLLEECGYLPRAAFRLDRPLYACRACGKQALTMCLGLGCNAAAVTGCRIMDSERERQLAVLTNAFMPCNGRFPMLVAILTLFFSSGGLFGFVHTGILLCGCILLSIGMTFAGTALLSKTILRGKPSSFTLELPPFRKPQIGQVLIRSLLDRTLKTAARAAIVAAPAGILIWLCANISLHDTSVLDHIISFLDPVGKLLGVDGVILTGFLLGFPANEVVLPAVLLGYTANSSIT